MVSADRELPQWVTDAMREMDEAYERGLKDKREPKPVAWRYEEARHYDPETKTWYKWGAPKLSFKEPPSHQPYIRNVQPLFTMPETDGDPHLITYTDEHTYLELIEQARRAVRAYHEYKRELAEAKEERREPYPSDGRELTYAIANIDTLLEKLGE